MDYKSISAGELSSRLDVQRSNISHILNGRNKPGASFIEKLLLSFPDLNARWLLTGSGEMVEATVSNETSGLFANKEKQVDVVNDSNTESTAADIAKIGNAKPIDKVMLLFSDGTFTDFNRK